MLASLANCFNLLIALSITFFVPIFVIPSSFPISSKVFFSSSLFGKYNFIALASVSGNCFNQSFNNARSSASASPSSHGNAIFWSGIASPTVVSLSAHSPLLPETGASIDTVVVTFPFSSTFPSTIDFWRTGLNAFKIAPEMHYDAYALKIFPLLTSNSSIAFTNANDASWTKSSL